MSYLEHQLGYVPLLPSRFAHGCDYMVVIIYLAMNKKIDVISIFTQTIALDLKNLNCHIEKYIILPKSAIILKKVLVTTCPKLKVYFSRFL